MVMYDMIISAFLCVETNEIRTYPERQRRYKLDMIGSLSRFIMHGGLKQNKIIQQYIPYNMCWLGIVSL